MDVKINSVKFAATPQLETFIDSKVKKLMHFYDQIIGAEVFLRVENTEEKENKIAEIKLEIKGNDLFAKKQTKTFEESTDLAVEALRKQLTKYKGKRRRA
ncbi:MAG: ribosome-associated translation inhibitor RaiA [Bacteroidetes bacterium]|jgi:putative sigma-54 modulation protein|nr:ribosome-associated translation inhibitor RaiA [Bacteroidota bacterium]